jgi:DNA modification methylase
LGKTIWVRYNFDVRKLDSIVGTIQQTDAQSLMRGLPDESFDLIVCDGPYAVTTHDWDNVADIQHFNLELLKSFSRVLKPGGAAYLFGKPDCIDFIDYRSFLALQSKIVWYQPSRLAQGRISYTNNYDVICYFTKGKAKTFNLDDIRVPQLVELEHRLRCERVPSVRNGKFGKTVFHPDGKNPGNVWGDIKQLTYKSKELVSRELLNTIQKPEKLMERLIKASSNPSDLVFDPFCGSGTVPVVCQRLGRRFVACEINADYCRIAEERMAKAANGDGSSESLFEFSIAGRNGNPVPAQACLV